MAEDLIIAELKGSSNSLWTISPPSRTNLIEMLGSNEDFPTTVSWSVQRYAMTECYFILMLHLIFKAFLNIKPGLQIVFYVYVAL